MKHHVLKIDREIEEQHRDVLVMTPDIEAYAPYISAVFDNPEEDRKRITRRQLMAAATAGWNGPAARRTPLPAATRPSGKLFT